MPLHNKLDNILKCFAYIILILFLENGFTFEMHAIIFHRNAFKEDVIIYDVSGTNPGELITDKGDYILTEDMKFLNTDLTGSFTLYKDPGYVHRVPTVKAVVCDWDKPKGKLVVGDLSDLDPDQMSKDTGDIDYNKFDQVIIVGQSSGAVYSSFKAVVRESAFDDGDTIQDEFNQIKVLDLGDENPFGFV